MATWGPPRKNMWTFDKVISNSLGVKRWTRFTMQKGIHTNGQRKKAMSSKTGAGGGSGDGDIIQHWGGNEIVLSAVWFDHTLTNWSLLPKVWALCILIGQWAQRWCCVNLRSLKWIKPLIHSVHLPFTVFLQHAVNNKSLVSGMESFDQVVQKLNFSTFVWRIFIINFMVSMHVTN